MEKVSVDSVVQKTLSAAPTADAVAKPSPASAPSNPDKVKGDSSSVEKSAEPTETLTAFEQELLEELDADEQTEFEALSIKEQRTRLDWMKRLYRREARQRTEDGKIRKAWSALVEAGVSADDLRALVAKRTSASTKAEAEKAEAAIKRGFERKLAEAKDADEREAIKDAEQTVRELVEDEVERRLGQRVKPLEEKLDAADRRQIESRRKTLESEINDLEEKEGFKGSLVETYRDDIRRLGLQHPDWSAWKLLHYLASEEELKQGKRAGSNGSAPKESAPSLRATPVVKSKSSSSAPSHSTTSRTKVSLEKVIGGIFRRK